MLVACVFVYEIVIFELVISRLAFSLDFEKN